MPVDWSVNVTGEEGATDRELTLKSGCGAKAYIVITLVVVLVESADTVPISSARHIIQMHKLLGRIILFSYVYVNWSPVAVPFGVTTMTLTAPAVA